MAEVATVPMMIGLRMTGLDKAVINKISSYMDKVLKPSINVSIKTLKIIFPLFFSLLLVNEKCNDL